MGIEIGADIKLNRSDLRRESKRGGAIVEREFKQAFKAVGRVASSTFRGLGKTVRALISTKGLIVGAIAGIGLNRIIKGSAALDVQQKALANQLGVTQRQVKSYIAAVNNASAGLLDFQTAATLANRALTLGVPQSSIAQLVEYVSLIATATNEADQAEERIKGLLTAVATGRTQSLLQFGIQIDSRALQGLSPAAKQAEVLRQSIEQLEVKTRALGVSAREPFFIYTGIFGNIKDIVDGLGLAVIKSDAFGKKAGEIARVTGNIAELFRSGEFGEVFGAVAFSVGEVLNATLKDGGKIFGKAMLEGIATVLDVMDSIDFTPLAGRLVASIAERIRSFFPDTAQIFGITEEKVAAARGSTAGVLGQIAESIRANAESVDATKNLREAIERINERFGSETRQNPTAPGTTVGDALGGPLPTTVTREQFEAARRRNAAGTGPRVQRFIEALSRDTSDLTEGRFNLDPQPGESDKDRRRRLFQGGINPDTGKPVAGGPAALRRRFGVSDDDSFPRSDAIAKAREFAALEQERDRLLIKSFQGKLTDADRTRIESINEQLSPTRPTITQPPGEIRNFNAGSPAEAYKLFLEGLGVGKSTVIKPDAEAVGETASQIIEQQSQRAARPTDQRATELSARDAELSRRILDDFQTERTAAVRQQREREIAAKVESLRRRGFNTLADSGTVESDGGRKMREVQENRQRLEAKEAEVRAENAERAKENAEKAQQELEAVREIGSTMSMLLTEFKGMARLVQDFKHTAGDINDAAREALNAMNA